MEALAALVDELPEGLRRQAFTHSSWVTNRADSYERLAFLGDAVLSLAITTEIMPRYKKYTPGRLTKIKAQAVSRPACAEVAVELGAPEILRAAAPASGGRSADRLAETRSTLAEVLEAVIGACYLTFGLEGTRPAVLEAFKGQIEFAVGHSVDFKSALQERLARLGEDEVSYRVTNEQGPPHDRVFEVAAEVGDRVLGGGAGRTKKEAEQEAAEEALRNLRKRADAP